MNLQTGVCIIVGLLSFLTLYGILMIHSVWYEDDSHCMVSG